MSEQIAASTVAAEALQEYVYAVLTALGAPRDDALLVASSLVASNLAGHDSHGVLLLPFYVELVRAGRIRLGAKPELVVDRGSLAVLDGRHAFGQVVGRTAVELAIERGRKHGVACILGRNASHLGRLGEYTGAVAAAELTAIALCNFQGGDQQLAPFGGRERRLTNNPISLAAPGHDCPVVIDIALSVVAGAKVWLARARGERLPEGWLLDREGRPSTDPSDLDAGGLLLPLGGLQAGHKGYGLIVLAEILAGILSGGGVCRADAEGFSNAFLLLAIDTRPLVAIDDYLAQLRTLSSYLKSAQRLPGVDEILLPGELEARTARRRAREGVPIETATLQALRKLGHELGVKTPLP